VRSCGLACRANDEEVCRECEIKIRGARMRPREEGKAEIMKRKVNGGKGRRGQDTHSQSKRHGSRTEVTYTVKQREERECAESRSERDEDQRTGQSSAAGDLRMPMISNISLCSHCLCYSPDMAVTQRIVIGAPTKVPVFDPVLASSNIVYGFGVRDTKG
jgi:hypothetical protein